MPRHKEKRHKTARKILCRVIFTLPKETSSTKSLKMGILPTWYLSTLNKKQATEHLNIHCHLYQSNSPCQAFFAHFRSGFSLCFIKERKIRPPPPFFLPPRVKEKNETCKTSLACSRTSSKAAEALANFSASTSAPASTPLLPKISDKPWQFGAIIYPTQR